MLYSADKSFRITACMKHWIPHFPAARCFPFFSSNNPASYSQRKNLHFDRNDNTRVPLIKNSRRFYILMRRTTISHFSCKRNFQTDPKGDTPSRLTLTPNQKTSPIRRTFLIYALLSLILNTNEPTSPERMDAVTIAAFAEVSSAGSAKESEARKMDIVNPIPARMLAPK